jgi:dihydropteroate synthase
VTAYANLAGVEVGDGYPVRILGAINVSPESFYRGSVPAGENGLRQQAEQMAAEGADLLDIGGMSTAPFLSTEIPEAEEIQRLTWAISVVRRAVAVPISADTRRSQVALAALDAGAQVINDVSGFRHDPAMAELVARRAQGVILMASEATPGCGDPMSTVCALLEESLKIAWKAGLPPHRAAVDPGIGFFRKAAVSWVAWDCEVIQRLGDLRRLDRPILVGLSRKSFIGKILGKDDPADRLIGSLAATAVAVTAGVHLIRTHDVGPTREAVRMAEALRPTRGAGTFPGSVGSAGDGSRATGRDTL